MRDFSYRQKKMENELSKSKSKLIMAVCTGEKVAIMVDKASSAVQKRLNVANAVITLVQFRREVFYYPSIYIL